MNPVDVNQYLALLVLLFALESVQNFVRNGRINPLFAKVIGVLNMRIVGTATMDGKLKVLSKTRGTLKALQYIVMYMLEQGYCGGRVVIAHHQLVIRQIVIRKHHSLDRVSRVIKLFKDFQKIVRDQPVGHHLALMDIAVLIPVQHRQITKVLPGNGAVVFIGLSAFHPVKQVIRNPANGKALTGA